MITKLYKQANVLWMDYLQCPDIKQATKILIQWQTKMDMIHAIQDQIINLFSNKLQDDATESYIWEVLLMDQGVYQDRSDDCIA